MDDLDFVGGPSDQGDAEEYDGPSDECDGPSDECDGSSDECDGSSDECDEDFSDNDDDISQSTSHIGVKIKSLEDDDQEKKIVLAPKVWSPDVRPMSRLLITNFRKSTPRVPCSIHVHRITPQRHIGSLEISSCRTPMTTSQWSGFRTIINYVVPSTTWRLGGVPVSRREDMFFIN